MWDSGEWILGLEYFLSDLIQITLQSYVAFQSKECWFGVSCCSVVENNEE